MVAVRNASHGETHFVRFLVLGAALWYYERTSYQGGYYEHPHVGQRCVRMAGL